MGVYGVVPLAAAPRAGECGTGRGLETGRDHVGGIGTDTDGVSPRVGRETATGGGEGAHHAHQTALLDAGTAPHTTHTATAVRAVAATHMATPHVHVRTAPTRVGATARLREGGIL